MALKRTPTIPCAYSGASVIFAPNGKECFGPTERLVAIAQSAIYGTAQKCTFVPMTLPVACVAQQMVVVNGVTINGNVDVGIYDKDMNSLVTKGSTVQAGATAVQLFNIADTPLNPGRYFLGFWSDSATNTFSSHSYNIRTLRMSGFLEKLAVAGGLPTGAVATSVMTTAVVPVFGIVIASTM